MGKHISFFEEKREHAFGVYSGCKCNVNSGWNKSLHSDPERVHPEYVEYLRRTCDFYQQKDPHTYSNWNRKVKLPYGEWQHYQCACLEYNGICRHSLKQEQQDDIDFQDKYLKEL